MQGLWARGAGRTLGSGRWALGARQSVNEGHTRRSELA